jgi:transposase
LLAPIENRPMVDKTSTKNGHHYVTLGVDLDGARVIHVTEGKGKATKQRIQQHLENKGVDRKQIYLANQQRLEIKGVDRKQIEQISKDLSPSFIAGAAESFLAAQIIFDLPCRKIIE